MTLSGLQNYWKKTSVILKENGPKSFASNSSTLFTAMKRVALFRDIDTHITSLAIFLVCTFFNVYMIGVGLRREKSIAITLICRK